jgi:hypothetical protein
MPTVLLAVIYTLKWMFFGLHNPEIESMSFALVPKEI